MSNQPSDEAVKTAVRQLFGAWNKRPNADEEASWLAALRPHFGKTALSNAMRELRETSQYCPSVAELLTRMRRFESNEPKPDRAPRLTEHERKRAERAAILSALWLHYEFGWDLEAHPVLVARFGDDTRRAAAAAREQYTRETIRRWMQDQAATFPAPCDKSLGKYLCG